MGGPMCISMSITTFVPQLCLHGSAAQWPPSSQRHSSAAAPPPQSHRPASTIPASSARQIRRRRTAATGPLPPLRHPGSAALALPPWLRHPGSATLDLLSCLRRPAFAALPQHGSAAPLPRPRLHGHNPAASAFQLPPLRFHRSASPPTLRLTSVAPRIDR